MTQDELHTFCLSLPHAAEDVKWGSNLCFLIARKMFAVTVLERSEGRFVSFKCTPERFAELIEVEGITPAAYMARNHWVTISSGHVLRDAELRQLIRESYELVFSKLPKRVQMELGGGKRQKSKRSQ